MKSNILFSHETVDWENISQDMSDCFDNLQAIMAQSQIDNDVYKKLSFDFETLNFSWGNIYELYNIQKLEELNANWFFRYAYMTFSQLHQLKTTPKLAESIEDLEDEFPNDCNSLFGCKTKQENLVYNLESYIALKNECESPKLRLGANQIQQLINTQYKHLFERIDTPTITEQGNLHGEQVQIHLNSGNTKNIGALNLDGTWKHPPENKYLPISNDAKKLLLEWGFRLPQE